MTGFVVVNREVLVARELERGGRCAPGLDFIRWRYEQLKTEVWDDADFRAITHKDAALSRAAEIAEARGVPRDAAVPQTSARFHGVEDRISSSDAKVGAK